MFRTLTERLFAHLMRLPLRFHLDRQTGAVSQTLDNGLQGSQIDPASPGFTFLPAIGYAAHEDYEPYHDYDIVSRSNESACKQLRPYQELSPAWAEYVAEQDEPTNDPNWKEHQPAGDPAIDDCVADFDYSPVHYDYIDNQEVNAHLSMIDEEGLWVPEFEYVFGVDALEELRRERPDCIEGADSGSDDVPPNPGNVVRKCLGTSSLEALRNYYTEALNKNSDSQISAIRVGRFCLQPARKGLEPSRVITAWTSRTLIDEHNGFFNQGFLDFLLDVISRGQWNNY